MDVSRFEVGHAPAPSEAGPRAYAWWSPLALVLLGAAALKACRPAAGSYWDAPSGDIPWRAAAQIWAEVALGSWMLSGLHRSATRWCVAACFGAFGCWAAAIELRGDASCGCFGEIHTRPALTAAFDFAIALAIAAIPAAAAPSIAAKDSPRRLALALALALASASALTVTLASRLGPHRPGDGIPDGLGSPALLRPEAWAGERFPLLGRILSAEPPGRFESGEWLVVLHRADCDHCRRLVPRVVDWARADPGVRVLFVEVPPGDPGSPGPEFPDHCRGRLVAGRLDDRNEWFVRTPALLAIRDGRTLARSEWPERFAPAGGL